MRLVMCALSVSAFAPRALADDLDVLRGALPVAPATFTRWSGFYVGGQASYGNANADFSNATQPLLAYSLRELTLEAQQAPSQWPVLGSAGNRAAGYGGFVGYNTQWQDLVLGVEGNYTHASFAATASPTPIARIVSAGGSSYSVTVSGTGALDVTDYGSLRARAGWVLGNFLPYGFAGFVMGSGDYSVTTHVYGQQNSASPAYFPCDPELQTCVDYDYSNSAGQNGVLLYGFSAGGGIDWAVTPNVFVRGELEFVQFAPINNIPVYIVNARVGLGLKF
jgi:opacity protein-like surface antigen